MKKLNPSIQTKKNEIIITASYSSSRIMDKEFSEAYLTE